MVSSLVLITKCIGIDTDCDYTDFALMSFLTKVFDFGETMVSGVLG